MDAAAPITLARKAEDILLSFAVQLLYFGDVPNWLTWLGATIVAVCVVLMGVRKLVEARAKRELKVDTEREMGWAEKVLCLTVRVKKTGREEEANG